VAHEAQPDPESSGDHDERDASDHSHSATVHETGALHKTRASPFEGDLSAETARV
jgi:hypothetical protein